MSTETIAKQLCAIAQKLKTSFTFKGGPISYEDVFSPSGLMPGLAKRADQLCSLCLGYGIGATFEEDSDTKLGSKVTFDDVTPDILKLACLTDVINELIKSNASSGVVSLDELMYD